VFKTRKKNSSSRKKTSGESLFYPIKLERKLVLARWKTGDVESGRSSISRLKNVLKWYKQTGVLSVHVHVAMSIFNNDFFKFFVFWYSTKITSGLVSTENVDLQLNFFLISHRIVCALLAEHLVSSEAQS